MATIIRGSLEHRIVEYASQHYPLAADELARALHVSERVLLSELRRMGSRGLVELDVLPDKVFVRLLAAPARPGGGTGAGGEVRGSETSRKKEGKGGDDPACR
jgi:hypothetical protein